MEWVEMRYVYIDGSALQKAIEDFSKAIGIAELPFDYGMFINALQADRAFFYDALPDKKGNEDDADYDQRRSAKEFFFSKLNCIPKMHVRTGTSKWSKTNGSRQKAVDVSLAVDAISHAYMGTTEFATIVASDLDFYPVLSGLTQTRVRTTLVYKPGATSMELIEGADNSIKLNFTMILQSCEPNFAAPYFPTVNSSSYPLTEEERVKAKAIINHLGNECAIWREADSRFTLFHGNNRYNSPLAELSAEHCFGESAEEILKKIL